MSGRYIIPLDLGDSVSDKSLSYLRRGVGEKEKGKRVAAYIGGAKKKIVVDTGPPDLERSLKYHPYSKSEPRKPEQEMEAQLAQCGVKPEDIDIVILTHLHWDHVGDVLKFPKAQFICSQEELRFALDPPACLYVAYEALQLGMEPIFLKVIERIKTVEMKETQIVEGVKAIPLPGHTPGSIGVVVETEKGPHVITGDAVSKYGNLQGDPKERQPYLMTGIYTDMLAMYKSFERIDEIVEHDLSRVIAGHDPLVFQKERYPWGISNGTAPQPGLSRPAWAGRGQWKQIPSLRGEGQGEGDLPGLHRNNGMGQYWVNQARRLGPLFHDSTIPLK